MHRQITARSQSSVSGTYIGELLDILGPSSAEHESLTIRANLADDFSNLRLETHIKHTISFIHNEIGYPTEVSFMSLKHVDKTTGGSDHDLDTALEVTDLGTLGRTTVDGSVSDARVGAELCAFLLDLYGKFTSRGEDESDGTISRCEERLTTSSWSERRKNRNG